MVNTNKLKGRMREMGVTQRDLSGVIGYDPATINRKINDKTGYYLKAKDIEKLIAVLDIDDPTEYFFTDKIAYMQNMSSERE
jgi:transcriptional regulator with XRE-family HTH domain